MNATSTITCQLSAVSARINAVLKFADPDHYAEAVRLREMLKSKVPSYSNLCAEDILLYEGREILYNCETQHHVDQNDPQNGWAFLAAFGNFKGGHVCIPHLGLRL